MALREINHEAKIDLFRKELVNLVDLRHDLCTLAGQIDCVACDAQFGGLYAAGIYRAGHRIVVGINSAYDLYLTREIKAAQKLEVAAGVKQQLQMDAKRIPGMRLLEGRFMVINQAMGLPKGRDAAHAYLTSYVEDMKTSGFVAQALARHRIEGATVAPPASR
jgi:hypothetical protein